MDDGEGISFLEDKILIHIHRGEDSSRGNLDCLFIGCNADFDKNTLKVHIPKSHKLLAWVNADVPLKSGHLTAVTALIETCAIELGFKVTFERR